MKRGKKHYMAEKELRRLKRRELLKMLLMQCEETERLQQETDETKEKMEVILESYERLKKKLDVKDERLNQKDEKIAELKCEIQKLKTANREKAEGPDSLADAARQLDRLLEETKKAVEQYMVKVKKQNPFEAGRSTGSRKRQNISRNGQLISMNPGQIAGNSKKETAAENESEQEYKITAAVSGDLYG